MKKRFYYVSWEKYHQVCFEMAKKIIKKNIFLDRIAVISRGGLIVSRILSDYLDLPISPFTIVAYTGVNAKKKAKVVEGLKARIKNEVVLLVDEVADTGDTYITALNYLKKFKLKKIYTAAPFIKVWTKYRPNFWQKELGKWIIFPYDIRETIKETKGKLSLQELVDLGLPKNQIEYFLRLKKTW